MALRQLDLAHYLRVDSPIPHDVRFLVEDPANPNIRVQISAHKFLLALISPVFQAQFYGQIRMAGYTVVVQDCDPWSFQHLIDFIYSSSVENFLLVESDATEIVAIQKLFSLIKTADRFMISSLVNLCNKSIRDIPINEQNVFLFASAAENINHIDILSRDMFYKCGVFIRNSILFDATFAQRVSEADKQLFELLAGMDILEAHLAIRINKTSDKVENSPTLPNNSAGSIQSNGHPLKDKDENENVEDSNLESHINKKSIAHEDTTVIMTPTNTDNPNVDAGATSQTEKQASASWIDKFKEIVNNTTDSKEMVNSTTYSKDSVGDENCNIGKGVNTDEGNIDLAKTKLNEDDSNPAVLVEKTMDTYTNHDDTDAKNGSLDGGSEGIANAATDSARVLVTCISENQVIQVESLAYYRATKWKRLNVRSGASDGPPSGGSDGPPSDGSDGPPSGGSVDPPLVEYGKMLRPPYHLMSLLRFMPGAAKGYSFTDKNTMIFVVMAGELIVTIHQTEITVRKGDCFYVPTKNGYNIVNKGDVTAELALVQYQYDGPLPQGQLLG